MCRRNGSRIPQALYYFEAQEEASLAMEHIELTHPSLITNLAERTAWALDWLSGVSAPPEDVIGHSKDAMGSIGGGLIRRRFFGGNKAPLVFRVSMPYPAIVSLSPCHLGPVYLSLIRLSVPTPHS